MKTLNNKCFRLTTYDTQATHTRTIHCDALNITNASNYYQYPSYKGYSKNNNSTADGKPTVGSSLSSCCAVVWCRCSVQVWETIIFSLCIIFMLRYLYVQQIKLRVSGDFCCSLPHHFHHSSSPPWIWLLLESLNVDFQISVVNYNPN